MTFNPHSSSSSSLSEPGPEPGPEPGHPGPAGGIHGRLPEPRPPGPQPQAEPGAHPAGLPDQEPLPPELRRRGGAGGEGSGPRWRPLGGGEEGGAGDARHQHEPQQRDGRQRPAAHRPSR